MIDASVPYSDGWWLQRLYVQLRWQQRRCDGLMSRYRGDAPLPMVTETQQAAVRWFVEKSRTNFEKLIVDAVLSRLSIVGIRTAVDGDEGGDAAAYAMWKQARGKLFTTDSNRKMLAMSRSFVIVGKRADGSLLVTAEDPRLVTAICDPEDPYTPLAALKLYHDDVADEDVAYLYLPGRVMVATRPRKVTNTSQDVKFNPAAYTWDMDILNSVGEVVAEGRSGVIPEMVLDTAEDGSVLAGLVPVVPFFNDDPENPMAEFEPHLPLIDRINQQILQRMTIATMQAFKQRILKGLPKTNPDTGEEIDYSSALPAGPDEIWNLPAEVIIEELSQADLSQILLAIRDDIKDLAAVSGTPLYTVTPDVANGSAEGASLQREQLTFKVRGKQDRTEPSHERVAELMFRMSGDEARAQPGSVEMIWAPAEQYSMSERANAIAQTKGVIPRYQQLTQIWGMTPAEATRALTDLGGDLALDQQYSMGLAANGTA